MRKEYAIRRSLIEVKSLCEYAINSIEHYEFGDTSAKQRVVSTFNVIEARLQAIKENEILNQFVFKDE